MLEQIAADEESLAIVCFVSGDRGDPRFRHWGYPCECLETLSQIRLKQQMLERGMSAWEVEQILKAGSDESKGKPDQQANPPQRAVGARWSCLLAGALYAKIVCSFRFSSSACGAAQRPSASQSPSRHRGQSCKTFIRSVRWSICSHKSISIEML